VLLLAALGGSAASAKTLGEWTDDDVNAGIAAGVTALDGLADKSDPTMIHWDSSPPSGDVTETAFAIAAIGAARDAKDTNVSDAVLADAKSAVQFLISKQDKSGGDAQGSWGVDSTDTGSNYATSIALMALSFFKDEPGAADAIAGGRSFEILWQNAPPSVTGNPSSTCNPPTPPPFPSYGNCGSWTYNPTSVCCGDGSNTGFGVTGLDFSGGVPGPTAAQNEAWARASQEIASNPYATQNDGGGSYEPGETFEPFRSSANGTGTIIFSFAYDGVDVNDPAAQAAITAGADVLDTYEANRAANPREAIYHNGVNRDAPCVIGPGCNWLVTNDGGYHYSLFALSKGLGSYTVPDITDPNNFYAKVADLLLSQQEAGSPDTPPGAWPLDPRDDGSIVGATSFSILALAKAGQKLAPVTPEAPPAATTTPVTTTTPAPPPPPPAAPPPATPAAETVRATVGGVPRGCASSRFTVRVRVGGTATSVSVRVVVDGKVVVRSTRRSFNVTINAKRLRVGRHRVVVVAQGGGRTSRKAFSFRRCAPVRPTLTG